MKKLFKFTVGVASVAAIIGGGYYFLKKHVLDYIKDDFDDFDDFDDPEDFDDFEEFDIDAEGDSDVVNIHIEDGDAEAEVPEAEAPVETPEAEEPQDAAEADSPLDEI